MAWIEVTESAAGGAMLLNTDMIIAVYPALGVPTKKTVIEWSIEREEHEDHIMVLEPYAEVRAMLLGTTED